MEKYDNSSYAEFIKKVKRVRDKRKHRIKNSYGVYDAYKYYRKHRPNEHRYVLEESQYFSIIRTINNKFAEALINGEEIQFPCRMGKLEVRKYPNRVRIKDGKIISTYSIDWDKTLRLWYEDKEAYDNKILVRNTLREKFKIIYNKSMARYNNKTFYHFTVNREVSTRMRYKAKDKLIDAFYLKRYGK